MKKASSIAKAYAIFSQGIISIFVLAGIGFFIGWKVNKESPLKGILAVVGALIGLVCFIVLVYKGHYFDDKPIDNKEGDSKDEE